MPIASINQDEGDKLLRMEADLHKRVISQETAISAISRAIRRSRAGLKNPNRPVGSFIFLGPTGVGKTELARALANFLFGSDHALIRFDMSEYMEKHSVSSDWIAPARRHEGGQLTEKVKRNRTSVVLLMRREARTRHFQHPDPGVRGRPARWPATGHFKNTISSCLDYGGFIQKKRRSESRRGYRSDRHERQQHVLGEAAQIQPEFITARRDNRFER